MCIDMVQELWNDAQSLEDQYWKDFLKKNIVSPESAFRFKLLIKMMPMSQVSNPFVCDVGSGPQGGILPYVTIPCFRVAIDPLFRSFRSAKQLKFVPVASVGEQLCFRDNVFDCIFSINSLDHAAVPEDVLRNIHSCVKCDGVFMFMVHVVNPFEKFVHSAFRLLRQRIRQPFLESFSRRVIDFLSFRIFGLAIASDSYLHPHYFTLKDLRCLLRLEGFVISQSRVEKSKFKFKDELFMVLFRN